MENTQTQFKKEVLFPAIYERANVIFPEFKESRQHGKRWESLYHLDGSKSPDGEGCYIGSKPEYKCTVADRNGGRERPLNYIDFYMKRNNVDYLTAYKALCSACNLTPPLYGNEEDYMKYQRRQERLLQIVQKVREDLTKVEGNAALKYLTEVRGYSKELSKNMGLGLLTEETYNELFVDIYEGTGEPLFRPSGYLYKGRAEAYPLVIPYVVSGEVLGFKFRSVKKDVTGAEKWQNTNGLDKLPFGLTDTKLTGGKYLDLDIVIVESELDALRAQVLGYPNIVAVAGSTIDSEGLQKLIKHGAKRITVALDTEETAEKNASTDKNREKMAKAAQAEGLEVYVADFPARAGEKMDLDDYFNEGYTIDDFRKFVENAPSFLSWKYNRLVDEYTAKVEAEGLTEKNLNKDFINKVVALCVDFEANPYERTAISGKVEEFTQQTIGKDDFEEYLKIKQEAANKLKLERETKKVLDKAQELTEAGETREAFRLLEGIMKKTEELDAEARFSDLLKQPSIDEILEELSTQPDGFHTSYFFDGPNGEPEQLIIPEGAITFICGLAGHGKSTFLMNLAVEMAQDKRKEGQVLYFTFEERKAATRTKIENIVLNEFLSKNNKRTLTTLHTTGKNTLAEGSKYKDNLEGLRKKEREALRIFEKIRLYEPKDKSVDNLVASIQYLHRNMKIKAVFIDYVQRIRKYGLKDTTAELKEICSALMDVSVSTGLPFIIAAQFNRKLESPDNMQAQNIAESADLERAANVMIGLWNSSFSGGADGAKFSRKGITLGTYGKIYAKVLKSRDGVAEIDGVFDYDGNLGTIKDTEPTHVAAYTKYLRNEAAGQQGTIEFSTDEANTAAPESDVIMKKDDDYLPF